ncbi:MAG TPA: hypothetical protein VJM33_14140, partial [Microthrixaceae bacterium]|nr:hypothetical protein [Microthrixaceae bacterium]
ARRREQNAEADARWRAEHPEDEVPAWRPFREGEMEAYMRDDVAEIEATHTPVMRDRDGEPIGCHICWPLDDSWPCLARRVADEWRQMLGWYPGYHVWREADEAERSGRG